MTVPFGHQNEHFKSSLFLVLMNRLMTCCVAIACLLVRLAPLWTIHGILPQCFASEPLLCMTLSITPHHMCLPQYGIEAYLQWPHLFEGPQTILAVM